MPPAGGSALLAGVIVGAWSFGEVMGAMAIFFAELIWLGFLFLVLVDVYRHPDRSGWAKAGWTLFVVFLPLVGALVYVIKEPDFAPFSALAM
jgi:hypothetical protein